MIFKSVFYLFTFVLISCKDVNSGLQWKTTENKSENFQVIVEANVERDDNFCLYYTTDGTLNFGLLKPIWVNVKGSNHNQKITFELPQTVKPTELRIDFGINPEQPEVILRKITLCYGQNNLEIPGTLIFSYLTPDFKKTTFDAKSGKLGGKMVSGIWKSPSLYPKGKGLNSKIEELFAH